MSGPIFLPLVGGRGEIMVGDFETYFPHMSDPNVTCFLQGGRTYKIALPFDEVMHRLPRSPVFRYNPERAPFDARDIVKK